VLVVGLTGGIGSGKSTVSALLAERGAVVVDADRIAREVVVPGGAAYEGVIDRFGAAVVAEDGSIDRAALAAIVFADAGALADLNALTHPAVGEAVAARLAEEGATDDVVVLDVPLLVETESARSLCAGVVVVDCPEELAVERLVRHRGMTEDQVRQRMAAQVGRDERLARADRVIVNDGSWEHLRTQVETTWQWIEALAPRF